VNLCLGCIANCDYERRSCSEYLPCLNSISFFFVVVEFPKSIYILLVLSRSSSRINFIIYFFKFFLYMTIKNRYKEIYKHSYIHSALARPPRFIDHIKYKICTLKKICTLFVSNIKHC